MNTLSQATLDSINKKIDGLRNEFFSYVYAVGFFIALGMNFGKTDLVGVSDFGIKFLLSLLSWVSVGNNLV